MALSNVMHDRFQVFDELSQLWNLIEQSAMTTEYGSETREQEALEDFRNFI